ncbi:M48 family metalloprotease [Deltaproteobacteria bacterium TL4]
MKASFINRGITVFIVLCCWTQLGSAQDKENFRRRVYQKAQKFTEADVQTEIEFGRNLAARILGKYKTVQDAQLARYVALLGNGLAAQTGRPELKYYFAVLDADEVNAYACPGGYIFITRGALQRMSNEAQLAGVLAHEITHIDHRHVVNKLGIKGKDQSLSSAFASLISGATGSVRVLMDQLSDKALNMLFEEGVDKQDERDADSAAIEMMATLGYDVVSYRNYIESLKNLNAEGDGKVLSKTHPSVKERVQYIDQRVAELSLKEIPGKTNQQRFKDYVKL